MGVQSDRPEPAQSAATLGIIGGLANRATHSGEAAKYVTAKLRELSAARAVILLESWCEPGGPAHHAVGIDPAGREELSTSPDIKRLAQLCEGLAGVTSWHHTGEHGEAESILTKLGFGLSIAAPLRIGPAEVGTLLLLGLPDGRRIAAVTETLRTLSTIVALVLRNSCLSGEQDQARRGEGRSRATSERAALGIAQIETASGRFLQVDQKYCDIVGLTPEELVATSSAEITHPDDRQADLANEERFRTGAIDELSLEKRYVRKDGAVVWVNLTAFPMRAPGGQPDCYVAVVEDITARKRVGDKPLASEEGERDLSRLLTALHQVSIELSLSRSADELCRRVVELGRARLGFDRMSIWFIDPQDPRWEIGSFGTDEQGLLRDERGERHPIAPYAGLNGLLERKLHIVYQADAGLTNPALEDCGRGEHAVAAVWDGAEVIGFLNTDNLLSGRSITENQQRLLVLLAHTLGHLYTRTRADEALRERDETIRAMVDESRDWIWSIDAEGRHTYCNPAVKDILGYHPEKLLGKTPSGFLHDDDRRMVEARLPDWVAKKSGWRNLLLRWRHKHGGYRYLESNAVPILDAAGELLGFRGVDRDVTERKQADEALQNERNKLQSIIDAMDDGLTFQDKDFNIIFQNKVLRDIWGEGNIGSKCYNLYEGNDRVCDGCPVAMAYEDGQSHTSERTTVLPSGRIVFWENTATPIRNWKGEVVACLEITRDITERRKAEQALRDSEEQLRLAVKGARLSTWDWDVHTDEIRLGGRSQEMFGIAPDLWGQPFARLAELVHPDDLGPTYQKVKRAIEQRCPYSAEYRLARPGGDERWIAALAEPVCDEAGSVVRMIGVAQDITERKRAEAEVRRLNEQLEERVIARTAELKAANEELEAFTYSVSHDLRAPVRHIGGFARILVEEHAAALDSEGRRQLQVIRDSAAKMGTLIDDLLTLSRLSRKPAERTAVDCERMVRDVWSEISAGREPATVELRLEPLPSALADAGLLRQVWLNLLENALKYTATRRCGEIVVDSFGSEGITWYRVRDNGVGFDRRYADKLFGVFQRLHREEEFPGTGVGLAIVQRIVRKHGGQVRGRGEVNRGATFEFTLAS